jgi:hypothetical protein
MTPQFILWGIPGYIAFYLLRTVRPARQKSGWDFVVEVGFLSILCYAIANVLAAYIVWCLPGAGRSLPFEIPLPLALGVVPVSEVVGVTLARVSKHWWKLLAIYHTWITGKDKDFQYTDVFFQRTVELLKHFVFMTLKTGKVYVGILTAATHDPNESTRYLSIVPALSGYRDEKQIVVYTTFYEPNSAQAFLVPASEVVTLSAFDFMLLKKFTDVGAVRFEPPPGPPRPPHPSSNDSAPPVASS